MLRAAKILKIPVYVTTQNAARLGGPVPELTQPLADAGATVIDKTRFSMWVPELAQHFASRYNSSTSTSTSTSTGAAANEDPAANDDDDNTTLSDGGGSLSPPECQVVIVGIESHICVTQTALDLLAAGHDVYVLADGVSSCNEQEVPLALARLRAEGATVASSESWLYETMGDAAIPEFRDLARLVKETGPDTRAVLASLLGGGRT